MSTHLPGLQGVGETTRQRRVKPSTHIAASVFVGAQQTLVFLKIVWPIGQVNVQITLHTASPDVLRLWTFSPPFILF